MPTPIVSTPYAAAVTSLLAATATKCPSAKKDGSNAILITGNSETIYCGNSNALTASVGVMFRVPANSDGYLVPIPAGGELWLYSTGAQTAPLNIHEVWADQMFVPSGAGAGNAILTTINTFLSTIATGITTIVGAITGAARIRTSDFYGYTKCTASATKTLSPTPTGLANVVIGRTTVGTVKVYDDLTAVAGSILLDLPIGTVAGVYPIKFLLGNGATIVLSDADLVRVGTM